MVVAELLSLDLYFFPFEEGVAIGWELEEEGGERAGGTFVDFLLLVGRVGEVGFLLELVREIEEGSRVGEVEWELLELVRMVAEGSRVGEVAREFPKFCTMNSTGV
jgi:hypothetical protein